MFKRRFKICMGLLVLTSLLLAGCSEDALTNPPVKPEVLASFKAEPTTLNGDPVSGQKVFGRLPCLTCHTLAGVGPNNGTAPTLDHIGTTAATRMAGVNAVQYLHHAVTNPQDLTVPDYHPIMPSFTTSASPQELNDLVAYLLSLK